jgi:hypothetical protein
METLCPFCDHRTPAEPDAQCVYCIHCKKRIAVDPADVGYHLTPAGERASLLEELLARCLIALEALLESPDLNLDCLEQATQDAIEVARETVQAVKMALNTSA